MIKEYKHLIKLQRFPMKQMYFKVCENEMLFKNKFSDRDIDKDKNMLNNDLQKLRNKSQKLRNEAQVIIN